MSSSTPPGPSPCSSCRGVVGKPVSGGCGSASPHLGRPNNHRRPGSERRHERADDAHRSEEHTSELQSPCNLVCRLLLEKKKNYRFKRVDIVRTAQPCVRLRYVSSVLQPPL